MTEEVQGSVPPNTAPTETKGESQEARTTWFAAEAPQSEGGTNEETTPPVVSEDAKDDGTTGEGEPHDDEGQSVDGEKTDKDDEVVPRKALDKRIDRFNRKLSAKDQEIAALKAKLEGVPQVPTEQPTIEAFNGDTVAFAKATTQWALAVAQQEVQRTVKAQSVVQTYQTREADVKKLHADYEDVIEDFQEKYKHVNAPEINTYLVESEVGPDVYYYLAKNHAETDRILALPPHRRLGELGKLEVKLAAKAPAKTPPTRSQAPNPVTPERGTAPSVKVLSDPNLSQAEYREMRMKGRKRF